MLKYWAKNRLVPGLLCVAALTALFSFAFTMSPAKNIDSIENENSIYLNSEIDYQIPSPSKEQLNEIDGKDFIKSTFGYYLTKTNIFGNKTGKINLLLSNDLENLSMTMFNEKTLIEKIEQNENYVYLDETAKNALNVKTGDNIKISLAGSSFTYTVSSIYKQNSLFKEGTAIVSFAGAIKDIYCANAKETSLSGAFIDSSNDAQCNEFLQTYKPLGRLKDRSEFDSDDAFETYNNTILNGNYANEISNFSAKRDMANSDVANANSKLKTLCIVGSIVIGILYFVISEILRSRKSEKKYFKEILNNKKSIMSYRVLSLVIDSLLCVGLMLVFGFVLNTISSLLIPILIAFAFILFTFVINLFQDKKYVR